MVLLLLIPLPKECPENTTLRIFSYERPKKKHILRGLQRSLQVGQQQQGNYTWGWEKRCDNSQKDRNAGAVSQISPVGRTVSTGEDKHVH